MHIPQGLGTPKYLFFISETLFMVLNKYLRPGLRNSMTPFLDLVSDSHLDHSLDRHPTELQSLVYMDDILVSGNDNIEIQRLQQTLHSYFHMRDLDLMTYFLVWR